MTSALPLIEKKKRGDSLSADELRFLCREYVAGTIPDYQVAAWLMAVCFRGMSDEETLDLTRAMVSTGDTLDWSELGHPVVDKHSTGGVGDKVSLVLVPLLAAAGLAVFKMSGRGLGHTGGTIDKLESIRGFRVELTHDEIVDQMRRIGCAHVGQSASLVPADRQLYALRDVTGTVDSIPLIAASVMSKKLAAGAEAIVLDVKYGSGAFMQTVDEARELARRMVSIGNGAGRRTRALLSAMDEPLGRAVGNALEVREAIETLRGGGPADLRALVVELGAHLLEMTGESAGRARSRLEDLLESGEGAIRFQQLIAAQGGDPEVVEDPGLLPTAPYRSPLVHDGAPVWVQRVEARTVADVALELGAGRRTKADVIDAGVGIVIRRKAAESCERGETLAEVFASSAEAAERALQRLRGAFFLADRPPPAPTTSPELVS